MPTQEKFTVPAFLGRLMDAEIEIRPNRLPILFKFVVDTVGEHERVYSQIEAEHIAARRAGEPKDLEALIDALDT